jgi:hypothetical protein
MGFIEDSERMSRYEKKRKEEKKTKRKESAIKKAKLNAEKKEFYLKRSMMSAKELLLDSVLPQWFFKK